MNKPQIEPFERTFGTGDVEVFAERKNWSVRNCHDGERHMQTASYLTLVNLFPSRHHENQISSPIETNG
ncbi:MAG: hypothetical protein H0X34_20410 [Chthoniobacterales bacterium]|nr:hypothetical protein [Chthoniobacterales bacterium]